MQSSETREWFTVCTCIYLNYAVSLWRNDKLHSNTARRKLLGTQVLASIGHIQFTNYKIYGDSMLKIKVYMDQRTVT